MFSIAACDTNPIEVEEEMPAQQEEVVKDGVSEVSKEIIRIAKQNITINTDDGYAIGVLDKGRTETSAIVMYRNETQTEEYRFELLDGVWTKGNILPPRPSVNDQGEEIQIYTKKIVELYDEDVILRDTWYIPFDERQGDGYWYYNEEYVSNKPAYAQFYEGNETDVSLELYHELDFDGWEYTSYEYVDAADQYEDRDFFSSDRNVVLERNYYSNDKKKTLYSKPWFVHVYFYHEVSQTSPPAAVGLTSPANGSIIGSTVTYDWELSMGVGDFDYQLQVDDDQGFGSTFHNSYTNGSQLTVNGHAYSTTYFWRVRAHNAFGYGDWSEVRSVQRAAAPPAIPSVVASVEFGHPKLIWSVATSAVSYELQKNVNGLGWQTWQTNSSLTYLDMLVNSTYFNTNTLGVEWIGYRVRSVASNGTKSGFSTQYYFDFSGTTPHSF